MLQKRQPSATTLLWRNSGGGGSPGGEESSVTWGREAGVNKNLHESLPVQQERFDRDRAKGLRSKFLLGRVRIYSHATAVSRYLYQLQLKKRPPSVQQSVASPETEARLLLLAHC